MQRAWWKILQQRLICPFRDQKHNVVTSCVQRLEASFISSRWFSSAHAFAFQFYLLQTGWDHENCRELAGAAWRAKLRAYWAKRQDRQDTSKLNLWGESFIYRNSRPHCSPQWQIICFTMWPEKVEAAVKVPEPFDLVIHDPMGKSEFQPMDCGLLIWVMDLEHKFFKVQYIYIYTYIIYNSFIYIYKRCIYIYVVYFSPKGRVFVCKYVF